MLLGASRCLRLNPANTLVVEVHDDLLQGRVQSWYAGARHLQVGAI